MFLKPEKLQNHSNEGKGREKKKERGEGKEENKKSNACTPRFFNSYFFGRKKLLDAKGPFGDNVINLNDKTIYNKLPHMSCPSGFFSVLTKSDLFRSKYFESSGSFPTSGILFG